MENISTDQSSGSIIVGILVGNIRVREGIANWKPNRALIRPRTGPCGLMKADLSKENSPLPFVPLGWFENQTQARTTVLLKFGLG